MVSLLGFLYYNDVITPVLNIAHSLVYTRVLTRVQLTSGHEPTSNLPYGCGLSQPGLQSGLGAFTMEANLGVRTLV